MKDDTKCRKWLGKYIVYYYSPKGLRAFGTLVIVYYMPYEC